MKTLKIIQEPNNRIDKAATGKKRMLSLLKSILIVFMLSGMIGLSSCAVAVRTPHPQRHGIIFLQHNRNARTVYKKPHYKKQHYDNGKHRGHDKH